MPAVENNPSVPIAAGRLTKVLVFASQVSPADYYGLSIDYGGGVLHEREIRAIAQQADFMLRKKVAIIEKWSGCWQTEWICALPLST